MTENSPYEREQKMMDEIYTYLRDHGWYNGNVDGRHEDGNDNACQLFYLDHDKYGLHLKLESGEGDYEAMVDSLIDARNEIDKITSSYSCDWQNLVNETVCFSLRADIEA